MVEERKRKVVRGEQTGQQFEQNCKASIRTTPVDKCYIGLKDSP